MQTVSPAVVEECLRQAPPRGVLAADSGGRGHASGGSRGWGDEDGIGRIGGGGGAVREMFFVVVVRCLFCSCSCSCFVVLSVVCYVFESGMASPKRMSPNRSTPRNSCSCSTTISPLLAHHPPIPHQRCLTSRTAQRQQQQEEEEATAGGWEGIQRQTQGATTTTTTTTPAVQQQQQQQRCLHPQTG